MQIIVPFSTGGGTDTWARTIAPFLQKQLGHGTKVEVVNKPGAAGVAGANEFVHDHSSHTILVSSGSNVFPYLLGNETVVYDFNEFIPILGSPVGGVVFVSPDIGITDVSELCNIAQPLTYAGISATGSDIVPLVSFELLGLDVRAIFNHDGKGASLVAFEQGKTNLDYQTTPGFLANTTDLVKSGQAVPLYSLGILNSQGQVIRDPVFPNLPSMKEAYKICHGKDPSGSGWEAYKATLAAGFAIQKIMWLHSDAPEEAITQMRQAAAAVVTDPEFSESAKNLIGDYEFFVGHEAQIIFSAVSGLSTESLEWLKILLTGKYGVRF